MVRLQKWILAVCMIMFFSGGVCAQMRGPGRGPGAEDIVNKMAQELNLTNEQIQQIIPVIKEDVQKRGELMKQMKGQGREATSSIKTGMEKITQETETQLAQYLSDEQIAKWKTLQQERKSKRKNFMRERMNGEAGESSPPGNNDF